MTAMDELRDDPLAFLRHYYLVLAPELFDPAPKDVFSDGTVRIILEDTTNDYFANQVKRPRHRRGLGKLAAKFGASQRVKATRQYKVRLAAYADIDITSAYICPYIPGQTRTRTVGNWANLMFTAELTGCTFGVGSVARDGTQLVCHANDANAGMVGGALGQQNAQQQQAQNVLGGTPTLFEPSQYRPATTTLDMRSAIVGVRKNDVWQFWAQVFEFTGTGLADMNLVQIA